MRLASYNILNGGEGRADPLAEVLLAQRADVIAIVEAENPALLERLAQRLKMDYVVAAGRHDAVALFSAWPIGDSINHAALGSAGPRSFLQAQVTCPDGDVVDFGVAHLHARADISDERIREREIEFVLKTFAPHRTAGRPHILMGDFNANSPMQKIDPKTCKPATAESWERNGGDLPRRVVQMILDAGYVDTLAAAHPHASTLGSFTTQEPGQRVDYIFAHGFVREAIVAAWIELDRLAKYASDHFPAGCEIRPFDESTIAARATAKLLLSEPA